MRLVNIPSRHLIKLYNGMYETTMKGSIIINYQPSEEYHLVNKKYVDDIVNNIDFSKLETTIDKNVFFNYPGDFEKNSSGDYMLKKSTGLTNGHIVFNVNGKGLSSSSSAKIPPELWGDKLDDSIINKDTLPSTPEGLGIKDAITTDGKGVTNKGFETTDTLTNPKSVITPKKERTFYNPKVEYEIGDIILIDPKVLESTTTDFTLLDGSSRSKKKDSELFKVVGDGFSNKLSNYYGHPMKMSNLLGRRYLDVPPTPTVEVVSGFDQTLAGFSTTVTKNKAYIFGGFRGDYGSVSNEVYVSDITDGKLTGFKRIGDLPEPRVFHESIVFSNRILLVGGSKKPNEPSPGVRIIYADILENGELGPWKMTDEGLKGEQLMPVVLTVGPRLYAYGGLKWVRNDGNKIITDNSYLYTWIQIGSDLSFGKFHTQSSNRAYMYGSDLGYRAGSVRVVGRAPSQNLNSTISSDLYYLKSDRLNVLSSGPFGDGKATFTSMRCISYSREQEPDKGPGFLMFLQGLDGDKFYNADYTFGWGIFHVNHVGGGNYRHGTSTELSPLERHYFGIINTSNKTYVLGGLEGIQNDSRVRSYQQPTLMFDFEYLDGLGLDDYSEFYKQYVNTTDDFTLPNLDAVLYDGEEYVYAIKYR